MSDELVPLVVIPMTDVPAGKMPAPAMTLVRRALEGGLLVRSTYALAFVPGVRRKVAGIQRVSAHPEYPGGEGDDVGDGDGDREGDGVKGGTMERVTVTRETVSVRVRTSSGWPRMYVVWKRDDEKAWSFDNSQVWHGTYELPRRVTASGFYL